jgi:hypothetical protein
LQALQVAVQAVAQQTPCEQAPELHVAPVVHAVPLGARPQLFVVVLQVAGDAQSASAAQVALQASPAALQAKGAQLVGVAALHVPAPSQARAAAAAPLAQVAAPHTVPAAYSWHFAAPSHRPLVPQAAAPASAHWASGSCPAGTLVQVPALPASAHDWHVPVHAVAQQTPCWQLPDAQSPGPTQVVPSAPPAQLPGTQQMVPLQVAGAAQSAFVAQLVLQPPLLPQTYGAHVTGVPGTQSPTPSQWAAGVSVPLAQLSIPQEVVGG